MKRFASAWTLFAVLSGWSLHAQSVDLRANIPFNFWVGNVALPAGDYLVHPAPNFLLVREQNGRHAVMVLRQEASQPAALKTAMLEFNHYRETYFLAKAFVPGGWGAAVPMTSQEKGYAKEAGLARSTTILLSRK